MSRLPPYAKQHWLHPRLLVLPSSGTILCLDFEFCILVLRLFFSKRSVSLIFVSYGSRTTCHGTGILRALLGMVSRLWGARLVCSHKLHANYGGNLCFYVIETSSSASLVMLFGFFRQQSHTGHTRA